MARVISWLSRMSKKKKKTTLLFDAQQHVINITISI